MSTPLILSWGDIEIGPCCLPLISRMAAMTSRSISAKLVVGDLAKLEPHLRLEQLIAQRRVVLHLGLGRLDDLVEHEPQAADQEGIKDEHG
jgi:hypothetical protein